MDTLINFCGKYRKWIYAILTLALILILCFPIQKTPIMANGATQNIVKLPFFASLPLCFQYLVQINETTLPCLQTLVFLDVVSFCFFVVFLILLFAFWIMTAKNRKFPFLPLFVPVLGIYILQGFFYVFTYEPNRYGIDYITDWQLAFDFSAPGIIFIVLICLYAFALLFGKLYPRMRPKISETVAKVKTRKTKSQRIEELEQQNAELQKKLDDLSK